MNRAKCSLLASLAVSLCVTGAPLASAADLPQRMPEYKAPVTLPVLSWTGCYIGGNAGYAWGRAELETTVGTASGTNHGFTGGGQIGCDYQFSGSGFVIGIRDMFNWTGLKGDATFSSGPLAGDTANTKTKWTNTLTGRLGYAFSPTSLFYVQGGGAWASVDATVVDGTGTQIAQFSNGKTGYDVGVGFEYKFAQNWSGFIEYNYMNFGSNSGTTITGVGVNVKKDAQNVLFGINWRM